MTIGAAGAVASGEAALAGRAFVSGDLPGVTYTPERCLDYEEYHPEAATCSDAAVAHHFDEVVQGRLAAGVLGLLVLGGVFLSRRTRLGRLGEGMLPDATVGAAASGVVAVWMLGLGLPMSIMGTAGAGAFLADGLAATVPMVAFGLSLRRSLVGRLTGWEAGSPGAA